MLLELKNIHEDEDEEENEEENNEENNTEENISENENENEENEEPEEEEEESNGKIEIYNPDIFYNKITVDVNSINLEKQTWSLLRNNLLTYTDINKTDTYEDIQPPENTIITSFRIDYSKINIIDPNLNLTKQWIESNKNNDNKIIIQDPYNEEYPDAAYRLYYPITLDVSNLKLWKVCPVVYMTLTQLEQKSYWPVSELTDDEFEATQAIDFSVKLKLGNVNKTRRVTWSDVVNNELTLYETAQQNNLTGITSYENTLTLDLQHKTITVNDGSTTTLRAAQDNCLGWDEVTIKARGKEDPDFAPAVVYPIPIMAFGTYTISPLLCVPSATQCKSITFTFADLGAAVAAGGIIGLLPTVTPLIATITTNGTHTYDPRVYPIPEPQGNICYSTATITVDVQPNLEQDKTVLISDILSSNQNSTEIVPTTGYDGLANLLIIKNINISTITASYSANGTYNIPGTAYQYYNGANITVNVQPNLYNNYTDTITSNGTYTLTTPNGYQGIYNGTLTIDVPTGPNLNIEQNKQAILQVGTDQEILPSNGYDAMAKVTYSILLENAATFGTFSNPIYIDDPTQTRVMMQAGGVQLPYVGYRTASCNIIAKVKNDFTDTITQNGNYTITVPQGFCGISGGTLNINVPNQVETKNVGYVDNGHHIVTPSSGKIGISRIDIDVMVPRTATNFLYKLNTSSNWSLKKLDKLKIEPFFNALGNPVTLIYFDNDDKHIKTVTVNSNTTYPLTTPYTTVPLISFASGSMDIKFEDENNKNLYQQQFNSGGIDNELPRDLFYCFGGCYPTTNTNTLKRFKFYSWKAPNLVETNVNASVLNVDTSLRETISANISYGYELNGQTTFINSDKVCCIYDMSTSIIRFERLTYGTTKTYSNTEAVIWTIDVPPNDPYYVQFGVQDTRNRYMYQDWVSPSTFGTPWTYTVPSDLTWSI